MTSTMAKMARYKRRLEALIDIDADSVTVTVAGVSVTKHTDCGTARFVINSTGLTVVADEMEISGSFANFKKNGTPVAFIVLRGD